MRKSGVDLFLLLCLFITLLVFALIGGNIFIILLDGLRTLPQHLSDAENQFSLMLSVRCASVSTALCFLLAVPTAYMLTREQLPCRRVVEVILELTMSLPYIVLGLSLLILFSSPLGKELKAAGLPVVFDTNGIIMAQLVVNLPFAIKLCVMALQGVDHKMELVAGLLGASPWQRFRTILLPLCRNALIGSLVLIWSRALGEFGATLMLVGVTRMKTETLPGNIYLNVSSNDLDSAMASAFVLLLLSGLSLAASNLLTGREGERRRYAAGG